MTLSGRSGAAQEASDYFNSLPLEQRKKLAPLLEEYRRMGIEEAARAVRAVSRQMDDRMRSIKRSHEESGV